MRKVFDSRQVCHLWANKSQDEARNSNGTVYFVGPELYSYGSHFMMAAHLDDGRVLVNDDSYGVTTSKHQSYMRNSLRAGQWADALHVPKLTQDIFRNLERCRQNYGKGRMPEIVIAMADMVGEKIKDMAGRRYSGKLESEFNECARLERHGIALLAYVANGKKPAAWPLDSLPDALPQDSTERAEFIKAFSRRLLIESADKACANAAQAMAGIEEVISGNNQYGMGNVTGRLSTIGHLINAALRDFKAAGKPATKANKLAKQFAELSPRAEKAHAEWKGHAAKYAMDDLVRDAYKELRRLRASRNSFYYRNQAQFIASKMVTYYQEMCNAEMATGAYLPIMRKMERVADWHADEASLAAAEREAADAPAYLPGNPGDSLRVYKTALRHVLNATRSDAHMAYAHDKLAQLKAQILAGISTVEADVKAKYLSRVADWKAGTIDHLSYDAGTYARIKGNEMQTSHGARVPLAHACRLAKIARRVIAHGGKVWPDGTGPMVGGFRVKAIRADGSATIGCHEFDGDEGMRLLALLESCEACAECTETEAA